MKNLAKAALSAGVMLAALHSAYGAEVPKDPRDDDAPGMEGCGDKGTGPSSSKEGDDANKMPRTFEVHKPIVYDTKTFVDVRQDLVLFSDETIDIINLHFTVHTGVTLTFRAPTINIKRDETSVSPLFELSGALRFEAVGSARALLDGRLVDEGGIVQVLDDNAMFTSGRDSIVRYHDNGITVSRMDDTDDLDNQQHKDVELSPVLKDSLATTHAKLNAKSGVPSSTFSSFPSPSSSSSSSHSTSSSSSTSSPSTPLYSSPASTPEDVDSEVESDVCATTPYFGTLDGRGYCPSPTLSVADTDTTTTSAGDDKGDMHATASADFNGDVSTKSGTRVVDDSNNGGKGMGDDHGHTHNDGSNNRGIEPENTLSTTPPLTPATDDEKPSVWSPERVPTVDVELIAKPSVASTDTSTIWANKHGDIIFAKYSANPSDVSSPETFEGVRMSVLVAADQGKLKRVVRARQELIEELEGDSPTHENRRKDVWGWIPFRSQLQKDVELVSKHFGDTWMTITDRACVEVRVDGICVLEKCGPYEREWMNRFPWRTSKNNDYQLVVTDDGMEVRLGERRMWGVAVDEKMG